MECTTANLKMLDNDSAIKMFNIILALHAGQALHAAYELKLFELIGSEGALSFEAIAKILNLQPRALQALLSMCVGIDLIKLNENDKFVLTDISKNLLLKESPFYLGGSLDLNLMNPEMYSFKTLKKALSENAPQVYGGKELFKTNEEQIKLAKYFTHAMHGKSMGMAGFWPSKIDLSQNQCMVDIGGGSGAHSINAVTRWPHLKAIVFDRPAVTEVAEEYISQYGLEDRIQTQIGDMWEGSLPSSDLHFYCDIFHDWTIDKCRILVEKSYQALKPKGRIVIHEMLFNENKTGPRSVAGYNLMMFLWTEGQQLSTKEMVTLLDEVGFVNIKITPTGLGDWSLVEGQKL